MRSASDGEITPARARRWRALRSKNTTSQPLPARAVRPKSSSTFNLAAEMPRCCMRARAWCVRRSMALGDQPTKLLQKGDQIAAGKPGLIKVKAVPQLEDVQFARCRLPSAASATAAAWRGKNQAPVSGIDGDLHTDVLPVAPP